MLEVWGYKERVSTSHSEAFRDSTCIVCQMCSAQLDVLLVQLSIFESWVVKELSLDLVSLVLAVVRFTHQM